MAKPKEGRDKEHYLGIIRSLKSEIRSLKKEIRRLQKSEITYDNFIEDSEVPELPVGSENSRLPNICLDCSKGLLIEKTLLGRMYEECSTCGWRSPVRKYEDFKE